MQSIFATIAFGPFLTEYHNKTADAAFRRNLFSYLDEIVLPLVEEPFATVNGSLTTRYNEERFCGPHSAVKDKYELKLSLVREGSADSLTLTLFCDPITKDWRPLDRIVLWTRRKQLEESIFRQKVTDLATLILNKAKPSLACPRCASPLSLTDQPDLFDLSCPKLCFKYNFHRDPSTGEGTHGHFYTFPT